MGQSYHLWDYDWMPPSQNPIQAEWYGSAGNPWLASDSQSPAIPASGLPPTSLYAQHGMPCCVLGPGHALGLHLVQKAFRPKTRGTARKMAAPSPVTTAGSWGTWCLTIGRWPASELGFQSRQQSSSLAMIYWKSVLDTRVWKKEKSKKHFFKVLILKSKHRNFPWWSSGWDSTLLVQGAQFDLVRATDPLRCN